MKQEMKIILAICLFVILTISNLFIYPIYFEYQCKTRNFQDFEAKITSDIINSNIVIVTKEEKEFENGLRTSYDAGASGIIFKQDKETYYALTAYHVVKDYMNAEYLIIPYGSPTYSEYRKQNETHVSLEEYYEQFKKVSVVFADEACDLAVISFESKKQLNVLSIEKVNPSQNEKIAVVSNPKGKRFVLSYGNIRSKNYYTFDSGDDLKPVKTFKHNAYVDFGSSGSVVLNQDMKIVGINIGGGTNFFHKFKYGAMVPCELILDFLNKNDFSVK